MDKPEPVATVKPGDLENYLGFRVMPDWAGDPEPVTLTKVNPTRVRMREIRAALPPTFTPVPDRPGRVRMYTTTAGVDIFIGVTEDPIELFAPAAGTKVSPVSLFYGDVTSWSADTPEDRAGLLNAIDRIDKARWDADKGPLVPIVPRGVLNSGTYNMATTIGSELTADINDALADEHTVWVLDPREITPEELNALQGLPGVAVLANGEVSILPKAKAHPITPEKYNATQLVWVDHDNEIYTGDIAALAEYLRHAEVNGTYPARVYVAQDTKLVVRPWSMKPMSFNEDTQTGTNAVYVTLPGGVVISATWHFDGRS